MTASADVPAQALSWYETTVAAPRERTRLTFDLDVDVCVIGGGLAGLTVARELARRNWSVAVLEAHSVGWNASGRNCGFVLPGFAETMANIAERVGPDHARALWEFADAGCAYVRDTIAETGMPGVNPVDGWLEVSKFGEDFGAPTYVKELRDRYGANVEAWSTEQVRAVLRSPLYYNAIHWPTAFHVHPLNYTLGLAAAAEQAGARIFEETPALEIDSVGIRKRIATPAARVRAAQIVLAGNVHLGAVHSQLAATLMPITAFVAVTAPIGERLHEVVGYAGAVSDAERAANHYRIVDGDRLLWGSGIRAWAADPRGFARRLRADIARTYPQLARVEIEHVWSGTLGRTVHRMPQIGEVASGLWLASGFGGHGLNTTAMAGLMIARAIAENDTSWRLFQPYELVWAGGATGRAVIQLGYASVKLGARMKALAARWRHPKDWPKPIALPEPASDAMQIGGKTATVSRVATGLEVAETAATAAAAEFEKPETEANAGTEANKPAPVRRPRRRRRPKRSAVPEEAAAGD